MAINQSIIGLLNRRIFDNYLQDNFLRIRILYKPIDQIQRERQGWPEERKRVSYYGKILHDVLTHEINNDLKQRIERDLDDENYRNTKHYTEINRIFREKENTPQGNLEALKDIIYYFRSINPSRVEAGYGAGPNVEPILEVDLEELEIEDGGVAPGRKKKRKKRTKRPRQTVRKRSRPRQSVRKRISKPIRMTRLRSRPRQSVRKRRSRPRRMMRY